MNGKVRRPRTLVPAALVLILTKYVSIYSAIFHSPVQLSDLSVPVVLSRPPNFSYHTLDENDVHAYI